MSLSDKLAQLGIKDSESKWSLSVVQEGKLIGDILDEPEIYEDNLVAIDPSLFKSPAAAYLMKKMLVFRDSFGAIPDRSLLADDVKKEFTADDTCYEDLIGIVNTPVDPRFRKFIREQLINWIRHNTYTLLYSNDVIKAVNAGDYSRVYEIIQKAEEVSNSDTLPVYNLFSDYNQIFDATTAETFSAGLPALNSRIGDCGPQRGHLGCFMAASGVGKTIYLVHAAIQNVLCDKKVLFITCETRYKDIMKRCIANYCGVPMTMLGISSTDAVKQLVKEKLTNHCTSYPNSGFELIELNPDESNCNDIVAIVNKMTRKGFKPDVLIIDYLELLRGNHEEDNKSGWEKQGAVSTQLRGLAKKLDCLVLTATQANRAGAKVGGTDENLDGTHLADSYKKMMAMDFLVSIKTKLDTDSTLNQMLTKVECDLFIAKNRHGQSGVKINCTLDYTRMKFTQK